MRVGKGYKRTVFARVLDIPEGSSGIYSVKHVIKPAGATLPVSNFRTALIGGQAGKPVTFKEETRWHQLSSEEHGVWMTDEPIEQVQADALLGKITQGKVLVGGLGLGYAVTVLAKRERVTRVVVVEKSQDVIDLVWPHLLQDDPVARAKVTVVCADLFDYLVKLKLSSSRWPQFLQAYYDIWQSDGERVFFRIVCPLLSLSVGIVNHRPVCWNENVMRGQLLFSLIARMSRTREENLADGDLWQEWPKAFFRWLYAEERGEALTQYAMAAYANLYGTRDFARMWAIAVGSYRLFLETREKE